MKREILGMACGHRKSSPLPESIVVKTREELSLALVDHGCDPGLPLEGDVVQAFEARLMQAIAHVCEDPDVVFLDFWAKVVWIGEEGRPLPRIPAVFERKTSSRLFPLEGHEHCQWQSN